MRFTVLSQLDFAGPFARTAPRARVAHSGYGMRAAVANSTCVLTPTGKYTTTTDCSAASQCGWKYKSDPATGACFIAADGTYATIEECLKASMKWKCNGTGQCVQDPTGTFATLADCKCYTCANNACAPVAAGATGTYSTITDCENDVTAKCGWKFGCNTVDAGADASTMCVAYPPSSPLGKYASPSACKCVSAMGAPGPSCQCGYDSTVTGDAAFGTVAQCQADTTAKCGWKFDCTPPILFQLPAGNAALPRANYPYAPNYSEPQLQYVPVGSAFIAYKPFVTVSGSQVSLEIGDGSDADAASMDVVLVPKGNFAVDQMDPNTTGSKVCNTMQPYVKSILGSGWMLGGNVTICRSDPTNPQKLGGDVFFFTGHKRNYNTNSGQGTPLNGKVPVNVGYQYQVYMRVFNATNDQVTAYWNAMTVVQTDS